MVAGFSNALKIIESIVAFKTLLKHQRGQLAFAMVQIQKNHSVVLRKIPVGHFD